MKVFHTISLGASAVILAASAAFAQQSYSTMPTPVPAFPGNALQPAGVAPELTTPAERPRPDYDRLGMREGAFLLFPTIDLSETYDSNILASQTGTIDDFYTTLSPALTIQSDWARHALALTANGQFKWYTSHDTENVDNGSILAQGRYDIETGSYIAANAGYALQHEDRSSPTGTFGINNLLPKAPIEYSTTTGYLGYVRDEGRIGVHADTTITSYSYPNTTTASGTIIPEVDRNRMEYVGSLRLSYEIVPTLPYQAFVRVIGNERQYNSVDLAQLAATGVSARRNSHGWEVDAGTAVQITRLVTGEIYAGYLEQDYQASSIFPMSSGPAFGGNLVWNITPLTALKGQFSQSVAETTLVGASSSSETNVQLSVEHEMLRNLLLLGSVAYIRDDYSQAAGTASRLDNTYAGSVGARYFLTRTWRLRADVAYSDRSSNVTNGGYNRLIATVGVQAGF